MDREIMIRWIQNLLDKATDKQIEYLLYFIKGYISVKK